MRNDSLSLAFLSLWYTGTSSRRRPWMRVLLFFSTIPIANIANRSRVTITGIMTQVGSKLAWCSFHKAGGSVIFVR
jgi:exosortase/archaeosortase family protein